MFDLLILMTFCWLIGPLCGYGLRLTDRDMILVHLVSAVPFVGGMAGALYAWQVRGSGRT